MSVKCEYCGRYFEDGEGWQSCFRDKLKPTGRFSVYTLHFCCMGHLDSFRNQTKMIEVNSDGFTSEETRQQKQIKKEREFYRTHNQCENCNSWYNISGGIQHYGQSFCSQECLNDYLFELRRSGDNLVGTWRGGDPYELEFKKEGNNEFELYATCTKESPTDHSNNSFKKNQILFKEVQFLKGSIFKGLILVPIQSGDQTWFNFTGTINNDEMSVEIGDARWGWGYKKIILGIRDKDELFEEAARLVVLHQQGTTSLLQRKMKIDYDHACKIIEQLIDAEIIGSTEDKSIAPEVKFTDLDTLENHLKRITNG